MRFLGQVFFLSASESTELWRYINQSIVLYCIVFSGNSDRWPASNNTTWHTNSHAYCLLQMLWPCWRQRKYTGAINPLAFRGNYSATSNNPLAFRGNYSATSNNMELLHYSRWLVGCYIWYSEEGTGRSRSPPRPLHAVPNVIAHTSIASVPFTI